MSDLWPHQRDFLKWAFIGKRHLLMNHPMGAGKSRTAIELVDRRDAHTVIILAPKSVVPVWREQFASYSRHKWWIWSGEVHGTSGRVLSNPSVQQKADVLARHLRRIGPCRRVIVLNYDVLGRQPIDDVLMALVTNDHHWFPRVALILDEVHRLKSPSGKQSRTVANLVRKGNLAFTLGLSGTPMAHSGLDLYGVSRALGVPISPSYRLFCVTYGKPENVWVTGGQQRQVYKDLDPARLPELAERASQFTHTVTQDQLDLGLPAELPDQYRVAYPTPQAARVYRDLENHYIAETDDGTTLTTANALTLTTALARAANGHGGDNVTIGDHKQRLLQELLEDIGGEPIVVFARFRMDLRAIQAAAEALGRRYREISGNRRDGLTEHATMAEDAQVLGVQLQAGGVGISLVRSRVAVFYSLDWRLSDYLQARARLRRPGQKHSVLFIHLVTHGTIDVVLHKALERREDIIDGVTRYLRGTHQAEEAA